nr:unnamed protein product [Callosobruchus chinensis]
MELSVILSASGDIKKNIFKLKPLRKDGIELWACVSKNNIVEIQKIQSKILRSISAAPFYASNYIYTAWQAFTYHGLNMISKTERLDTSAKFNCFHESGNVLASADNEGNFYIVDFHTCKYWGLPKLDSCTFLKFSAYKPEQLMCGRNNGDVCIVHYEAGTVTGTLYGHKSPVKDVTFGDRSVCLTTSQYEAIVWSLDTNTKIQVLNLEKNNALKHVVFIPKSNYILACFQDDLIQVWDNTEFDSVKQFLPINWKNYSLLKIVNLPEHIHTVKHVEFVQRPFDGGANRVLAVLSGQGTIYFYNVAENMITNELTTEYETSKFSLCPKGSYIACVLCSGDVELYCLSNYIAAIAEDERMAPVERKISEMLEINKLRAILAEFGTYPEAYRTKIWEKLLQLPNNIQQYNSIINHVTVVAFEDLKQKYPLDNKLLMKSLRKLLNNLTTWNSFFASVDYMPIFAFPFIRVFNNKPVACFEAICTVICNWCQHFFEYHPLPPVNVLAMIENCLLEHDPMLLHHYSLNKVTAQIYAWPLLESAFSEVLTASEWLQIWDHFLTYEQIVLVLLEEYKKKEILWKPRHPLYYNTIEKEDAWREIAEVLNVDVQELKKKMESLKGSFRREKSRVKKGSGTGKGRDRIYISKWFAYEKSSLFSSEQAENTVEPKKLFKSPQKRSWSKTKGKEDPRLAMAFDYLVKKSAASNRPKDECQLFADYVANKMRKFNDRYRATAQHRISNILYELEMEQYNFRRGRQEYCPQQLPDCAPKMPRSSTSLSTASNTKVTIHDLKIAIHVICRRI